MRYAIWSAVSTAAQAAGDKVSLDVQIDKCREMGAARSWQEVAVYRVEGESRTRYVDLAIAQAEIPQLREMLDAAQARLFDVVITYDFNRFRELLPMVSRTLSAYHVQIASVSQWAEPLDPARYTPYSSDVSDIMQGVSQFVSRLQINDLRRKYSEAMPRRAAERGLPVHVPFGYRRAGRNAPPEIDPETAPLVIAAKDMLLAGKSLSQIVDYLSTTGHAPQSGKWYPQTVRDILRNPFYAGVVRWGLSKTELDPRTGRRKKNRRIPADKVTVGIGLHQPLWDEYTHKALVNELTRRGRSYAGKSVKRFTAITSCGVCGARLWIFYNSGNVSEDSAVWKCSADHAHTSISEAELARRVAVQMVRDIAAQPDDQPDPAHAERVEALRAEIAEWQATRRRIGDAYDAGAYGTQEMLERVAPVDAEISGRELELAKLEESERDRNARRQGLAYLKANLTAIPGAIERAPAADVNYLLRSVLRDIVVTEDGVETRWK